MQGLGIPHLIILLVIFLIFFGPSRLPQLGQSLGKAIKGFKDGLNELNADAKDVGPQQQLKQGEAPVQQAQTPSETKKENS
jgi:sec-independent protein translocase protein TatA